MGYKNKISKEQILESEIVKHLNEISRIGESRHEAKKIGEASEHIYSIKTYEDYKQTMKVFAKYCLKEHPEVKHISDCKQYVEEYINYMIEKSYSSFSQKSRLSGLRKYYNDRFEDVKTEGRVRSKIRRSRYDTDNSRHFSEEANAPLVHFCKCTGLRRSELERLKGQCVSKHLDGNWYIDRVKGKGGRVRDVRILNNDQEVIDKINNTPADQLVWSHVHTHADIHGYRADYCRALYYSVARDVDTLDKKEIYICRKDLNAKLDRAAMKICSESLGHSRLGIISYSYWRSWY